MAVIVCIPESHNNFVTIDTDSMTASSEMYPIRLTSLPSNFSTQWATHNILSTPAFSGGILGPNGRIYCPGNASFPGIIDPTRASLLLTSFGLDMPPNTRNYGYLNPVLAPNNLVYCAPNGAGSVLVINPWAETASLKTMGANLSGWLKFCRAVIWESRIICPPRNSANFLIINTLNDTATRPTLGITYNAPPQGSANYKFVGAVLAPNNKIYCLPFITAPSVLILDPSTLTWTWEDFGIDWEEKPGALWSVPAVGKDGKIYCLPTENTNDLLIIDPFANTAERSTFDIDFSIPGRWNSLVPLPDGRLIGLPGTAKDFVVIDPASRTGYRSTLGFRFTSSAQNSLWADGVVISEFFNEGAFWANMIFAKEGKIIPNP